MVPDLEIHGVGGPEMAEVAGPGLRDWVEDAAVMGVWEVLKRYGWFKQRGFLSPLQESGSGQAAGSGRFRLQVRPLS